MFECPFGFFSPWIKDVWNFSVQSFSPKNIHFAGLFWLQIFYLLNEMLLCIVSNGHLVLTILYFQVFLKKKCQRLETLFFLMNFFFLIFCSCRNVENQLFTQFYLSEGLGQVSSYFTQPFQLFSNICKFPLALWLSDSLVCQTLAA